MKHVIKTSGKVELFSDNKLQKSIVYSLQAVHKNTEEAVSITNNVMQDVTIWLKNKHEVSVKDIRTATTKALAKYDKDAAVVYKKHKDMW